MLSDPFSHRTLSHARFNIAIADWLEQEGYSDVGMAGMSMGGINACLAAAVGNRKIALTPLIAPYSAGPVFTTGTQCHDIALLSDVSIIHAL